MATRRAEVQIVFASGAFVACRESSSVGVLRQFAARFTVLSDGEFQWQTRQQLTAKNARLEARITVEQKELIERAAGYEGRSVSDFVVATVQQAVKAVIQEHELLRLN